MSRVFGRPARCGVWDTVNCHRGATVGRRHRGRRIDALALELGLRALSENPDLRLSINMSARSIGYPDWSETLDRGLSEDPTVAERLILEITEASAMVMPDIVSVFMDDLQIRGVSFALDDFGAGFTSISARVLF